MSNKTIAQLDEKTPVNTDLVPVADPVTGIAGKSSVENVSAGGPISSGSITLSPSPVSDLKVSMFQINGMTTSGSVRRKNEPFFYGETYPYCVSHSVAASAPLADPLNPVTSLTINVEKLSIATGSYFNNYPNLTSFSAPNLKEAFININQCVSINSMSCPELTHAILNLSHLINYTGTLTFPKLKRTDFTLQNAFAMSGLSFPELTTADQIVISPGTLSAAPNFNSISAPKLKYSGQIQLQNFLVMPISFPELEQLAGNLGNTGGVTSIDLPKLKICYSIFSSNSTWSNLTSINLPMLQHCVTSFINSSGSSGFSLLTTIDLPELISMGCPTLTWTFGGGLTKTYGFLNSSIFNIGNSSPNLTSINLPKLQFATGSSGSSSFNITAATNLSTFTINPTPKYIFGNFIVTNAALNQASVDGILVALAYMDGTANAPFPAYSSKTINLSGGTSATPSATGLAAKATLVARGCTVTHN